MNYKNGVLSVIFGLSHQLIVLCFGLIIPRLFIGTFGSEMNGLLSSLGNLYSYLALLEAGVGTVAIQALYGPVGRNDRQCINEILSAINFYYNRAGFFYLLGVLLIAFIYPIAVSTMIPFGTIVILTILSGLGGVINFWIQGKYMILLQAEGKKYMMSIVSIIVYIGNNIIKIILLKNGFNVISIHIGALIICLTQMVFWVYYIKRYYPWINLHTKQNRAALSQSGAVFVQQIMWMICNNTDIAVLTFVGRDLKAVSVYSLYLMIFSVVERLFSTFFGSFHYLLGQIYNTDRKSYMKMHSIYESISMFGSFAMYTVAFVFITPFMRIYTNGITDISYVDKYLPFLFTFMHLLSSSREASSRVINFAGHFKQMEWRATLETFINFTTSVFLVKWIGIYGVLLGTIIAYFYRTNDIIIYANRKVLKRRVWCTYKMWIVNMMIFAAISVCFRYISVNPSSMVMFFAEVIPCGVLIVVLYMIFLIVLYRNSALFLWNTAKKGYRTVFRGNGKQKI